jgi:inhibitor of cysteine peptidase
MSGAAVELIESDDGKTVEVQAGDMLVVRLHENPSTGFRWQIEEPDSKILRLRGSDFVPQSAAVGSGGDEQWTFEALAPGQTQLGFKLWRHWEGEKSVQKRFAVSLAVKG